VRRGEVVAGMSLTARLARGELARWCAETCYGVPNIAADLQRRLAAARHPKPVRPAACTRPVDRAGISAAFTQRLGLLVEGSAPAAALLGPLRAGLASRGWADTAAALFGPSKQPDAVAGPFSPYRRRVAHPAAPVGDVGEHETVLAEFAARTARFLTEHAPPGSVGTRGAETALARTCWVLGS
jgi:hypothetical protein